MADTSPGKVQALRAMFAEKDSVMRLLPPPNSRNRHRPWKRSMTSLNDDAFLAGCDNEQKTNSANHQSTTRAILKALQKQCELSGSCSTGEGAVPPRALAKPAVGPKPVFAKLQRRTSSPAGSNSCQEQESELQREETPRCRAPPKPKRGQPASQRVQPSTSNCIESTDHAYSNGSVAARLSGDGQPPAAKPVPSPTANDNCPTNKALESTGNLSNDGERITNDAKVISQLNLINSDNYICKSKLIRNKVPHKDSLGPPPLKPSKPPHMVLPTQESLEKLGVILGRNSRARSSSPKQLIPAPTSNTSLCNHKNTFLHPPPRPTTAPPVPPPTAASSARNSVTSVSVNSSKSLFEEIEELYEDTLLDKNKDRPTSLIADYSVSEECEELYDDADESLDMVGAPPCPPKPRHPPPPPPLPSCLDLAGNPIPEELYQDAEGSDSEFYEEMPTGVPEESHYMNNRKEMEKLRREKEKRLRKESKEKEKKEKEMEKVKKKFGLLGDEIPIDAGVVKSDSRGGRSDLPVSKGEKVYILRIEGNPAGKWLVRNKKGKYGYVELTNIEVDPDSVKSVMTVRRTSVISNNSNISNSEELYSEAYSEQEAIYETTY